MKGYAEHPLSGECWRTSLIHNGPQYGIKCWLVSLFETSIETAVCHLHNLPLVGLQLPSDESHCVAHLYSSWNVFVNCHV